VGWVVHKIMGKALFHPKGSIGGVKKVINEEDLDWGWQNNPHPRRYADKIRHGHGADTLMDIHG